MKNGKAKPKPPFKKWREKQKPTLTVDRFARESDVSFSTAASWDRGVVAQTLQQEHVRKVFSTVVW